MLCRCWYRPQLEQLLVGAAFNDAAMVHHQHLVGMLDGRQPVRDDQRGAFGHQALQRVLHQALGFVVQRRSGFVEDKDRGVAQDRAGDRQALALATGQQRAVRLPASAAAAAYVR